MDFTGTWRHARNIPQDIASAVESFELRQEGNRVTGRYRRVIEGVTEEDRTTIVQEYANKEFSATVEGATITVVLGGSDGTRTLKLEGRDLLVDGVVYWPAA